MKKIVYIFIMALLLVSCSNGLLVNKYDKNVNMELGKAGNSEGNKHTEPSTERNDTTSLCFTARKGSVIVKFDIKKVTHTIQYSTDGINWSDYTSKKEVTINADQSIYFRAATNQTTASAFGDYDSTSTYSHFTFTSSDGCTIEGSGNIMSLYGPDCPNLPLKRGAFANLFFRCNTLTTAPKLPATTLNSECYSYMFFGCTSLTMPPALPATTLAMWCYDYMFGNCTSLTTAPALPATTMETACYQRMFYGCTSLTSIPELPATTLATWCYNCMFYGCSSLIVNETAPGKEWKIPATSTKDNALTNMFSGTSGTMNGTPEVNTTYYIASDPSY